MLTNEQRGLVRDNMGLVGVHLRRNVVNLSHPKHKREWDDLFQEGCLGLIRAATAFRQERGIPFASFALPRIHNAVSRALQTKFDTIYSPPPRTRRKPPPRPRGTPPSTERTPPVPPNDTPSPGVRRDRESRLPKNSVWSSGLPDRVDAHPATPSPRPLPLGGGEGLSERPFTRPVRQRGRGVIGDARMQRGRGVLKGPRALYRKHPGAPPEADPAHRQTIGERLREKYERAVKAAAQTESSRASRRGDRKRLVRALVEERFLVPEESSRRPLRHIARDTRSSYGRVADCDKQLNVEIRRTLEADPEFRALQRISKTDPVGAELSIDEDLERQLAGITAAEFTRRFAVAPRDVRASMLQTLLELSPGDLAEIVQSRIASLPTDARERLLRGG